MSVEGDAFGLSDVGLVRQSQEDSFAVNGRVLVVADGMGGHQGGEVASKLAVDTLVKALGSHSLPEAANLANKAIWSKADRVAGLHGMATTLVAGRCVAPSIFEIISIGDSRAYRVRRGQIQQLTKDDSLLNQLLDEGAVLSEKEKAGVPSNIVTRALGMKADLDRVIVSKVLIEDDDLFLLCSDGLHGMLSDNAILSAAKGTPKVMVNRLIERALAAGGTDNVTVIAVLFSVSARRLGLRCLRRK